MTKHKSSSQHRHEVKLGSRITAASIFNCEDITRFIESIVNVLPYRGYSDSRFFTCELNNIRFLTKLCFYHKSQPELYAAKHDEAAAEIAAVSDEVAGLAKTIHQTDAEIRILELFRRRLIEQNITPCILELIYSHECASLAKLYPSADECEYVMKDYRNASLDSTIYDILCGYKEVVSAGLAYDKAAFLVLERCDMTLESYLQKSINTPVSMAIFKSLLFQIVYTIWAIKMIWPTFAHLDLHTENIMLKFDPRHRFSATDPKFIVFSVNGRKFTVPYFGIIPKIIDFGFSIVPEAGIISNIVNDRIMMFHRGGNDLTYLFHWIQRSLLIDEDKRSRVRELLTMLDPDETYIHVSGLKKGDSPSAEVMLSSPAFEDYSSFVADKSRIYASYNEPKGRAALLIPAKQ